MAKDYTRKFQNEILKKHLIVGVFSVIFIFGFYFVFDYFYNGAIIDLIDDVFGYSFALFVKQNQNIVIFMVLVCILLMNSLIVEIYAINKISHVFSQIKILFQKDDERIILDQSLHELEEDLNTLKKMSLDNEKKAIQEAQRKVDMIAYLAHDIKTPLASIIGYLCLLDETYEIPEELRKKYTHLTLEKAYRLEKLINEFFDIAKLNQSYHTLVKEEVDLSYLLEQMKEEFYPIMQKKHQKIDIQIDKNMKIFVDANKMARVFNNILKNAFYYGNENSTILIKGYDDNIYSHILFVNDGPRIPQEKLDLIFEQFYRLDQSRSSSTGGSGLGLSIAKMIVEQHGGMIKATSEEQTCFEILIPHKAIF